MKRLVLVFLIGVVSMYGGFKSQAFKRSIKNIPPNRLAKTVKEFGSSKSLKEITSKISMKKLTPIDKLAKTAEGIAKKSPINEKLMSVKNPLDAMYLYSKGGDTLFNSIGKLSRQTATLSRNTIKKVSTKIPNIRKISTLSQKQLLERSVKVIKATGDTGLKIVKGIGKLANDNKFSAIAGVMYAWYLADPHGFKEKLDEFGGNLQEFASYVGGLIGEAVVAGAQGFFSGVWNAVKEKMDWMTGIILGSIALLWLLFKFKDSLNFQKLYSRKEEQEPRKRKKRGGRF